MSYLQNKNWCWLRPKWCLAINFSKLNRVFKFEKFRMFESFECGYKSVMSQQTNEILNCEKSNQFLLILETIVIKNTFNQVNKIVQCIYNVSVFNIFAVLFKFV